MLDSIFFGQFLALLIEGIMVFAMAALLNLFRLTRETAFIRSQYTPDDHLA